MRLQRLLRRPRPHAFRRIGVRGNGGGREKGLSEESPLLPSPTPPPLILQRLFPLSNPIRSIHYAQESLPHDDTIPDPAVVIKKRPNTRTYPGVFTFSSNGTAAGRPPNQSKVLGGKRNRGGALPFSRKVPLSLTTSTLAFCLYRKSRSFRCPSSSRYNLYTTESTSPCQLASMMSCDTPTVTHVLSASPIR